jgi:hypothetical protein
MQRVCALVTIVALLLAATLTAPSGGACSRCPRDCPMHQRGKLGCHRTPGDQHAHAAGAASGPAGCVLRSTCGYEGALVVPPAAIGDFTPRAVALASARVGGVALPASPLVSLFDPEPPVEPPRPLLA